MYAYCSVCGSYHDLTNSVCGDTKLFQPLTEIEILEKRVEELEKEVKKLKRTLGG